MATGSWFVMGVDLGSTTAKAAVVDEGGDLVGSSVVQMGAVSREAVARAMDGAMAGAGVARADIRRTISTGYGRKLVPGTDRTFTEITCHARGAAALHPGVRLVIDIGGQDSKAIIVDDDGLVERFAMNDRCASGTGRFFDVLARALEVDVSAVGELALTGSETLEVSSMCATFAETEVISLLAQGREKADIAASVHKAVAARTLGLVAQVGKATPTVMTGGVAKNPAARLHVSRALGHPVEVLDQPQIAGAYGAGLLARDDYAGGTVSPAPSDGATEEQFQESLSAGTPHCQDCDGSPGHPHPGTGEPVPLELQRNIR
ncbi:putative CoA-substrate-specific enzyme activase [Rhodococcus wratislaviensis]|uniref:(R)-2-hydroxyglutaryl-CoA dehydratase activator n=2 Tax=Rhodococcus wratislaviensis TaxID=44752 RepID=X0R2A9_RHOWR|nr:acyl-CoA dehydratase activase [Rhodococcus wratislaviensis]REE74985.1 putative CoA-substrate-specific enzyme activase [Rhodococcus wratislaviensis]GAF44995.1 (R)-2-hydroxyglutaryl-CoA dehydratase activator [Rhodococcus wratislaviensis NBRC 100605]